MFKKMLMLAAFAVMAVGTTAADTSGMPFFKDGDSSVTNRADTSVPAFAYCSNAFTSLARVKTVALSGLNLRVGRAPIVIILR